MTKEREALRALLPHKHLCSVPGRSASAELIYLHKFWVWPLFDEMPSWKKCIFGCQGGCPVFSLPKREAVRQKWLDFIFGDKPSKTCYVCARHFTDDCFLNKSFYESGLITQLSLSDTAVPTLKTIPVEPTPTPVKPLATSSSSSFTYWPNTRSVSTQLSAGTLRTQHYRSRGAQATVGTVSRGTITEQSTQFSSTFIQPTPGVGARPSKRARLEMEEGKDDVISMSLPVSKDEDDDHEEIPVTVVSDLKDMESRSEFEDVKYIVFESALRELFENCPLCNKHCVVQKNRCGTFVAFSQFCPHCSFSRKWQSQPMKGNIPQGNLELSAAVYFNGGSFPKIEKICNTMNLQVHQYDTFRSHARNLLEPAICHKWKVDQGKVLEEMKSKGKIAVSGDMRADSPGHSATFGSYTIMENEDKKILDVQLLQSNEADGSANMEKEGLKRSLDLLESNSVKLDYIVTDRRPQVQKYLREREMSHYYNAWYMVKGLSKKMNALAKKRDCKVLQKWLPDIRKHMYWTACSSATGPEKVTMWTSLVNDLENVDERDGTVALRKVKKMLLNKSILKDMDKLSSNHQTSALESFHSLILRFAPKNVKVPFTGKLCRLYLAAMHYNENATRELPMGKEKPLWRLLSAKGQPTATPLKTDATFGYRSNLMELVFNEVLCDPKKFQKELQEVPVPPPLCSNYNRPCKEDVVAVPISGFNPVVACGPPHSLGTSAKSTEQHMMG